MVRTLAATRRGGPRSPRASGGGPAMIAYVQAAAPFSPRERGWSEQIVALGELARVLPARAGVVRQHPAVAAENCRSPRASGGGPSAPGRWQVGGWFSPRERGWSADVEPGGPLLAFSPRERGWSGPGDRRDRGGAVLPARAGVVRRIRSAHEPFPCSPRASGGGPSWTVSSTLEEWFSPRERGWSVYPAARQWGVGVLPARAGVVRPSTSAATSTPRSPRASGGGPEDGEGNAPFREFSPRERGWSDAQRLPVGRGFVLPARAGVVRAACLCRWAPARSPRASGGGPNARTCSSRRPKFSPRKRGWSANAVPAVPASVPATAAIERSTAYRMFQVLVVSPERMPSILPRTSAAFAGSCVAFRALVATMRSSRRSRRTGWPGQVVTSQP